MQRCANIGELNSGKGTVRPDIETADIVVGVLAALGIVVLIVVFVLVFRAVILKKD